MHDPDFLAEMERTLREVEKELEMRVDDAQESEDPMMNSAVGRLSFIDAFQQHQLDLHSHRKMKVQLTSVKAALDRLRAIHEMIFPRQARGSLFFKGENALSRPRKRVTYSKAGPYGVCESCGTDIPQERLEYLPDTRFCTSCHPGAG